ncbi:MAG: branched-chain amino acid ABC transporter ATP-binding protein [Hyphomicrobiales bacterium]|nr:MAG: branched-chain amino acid ABC transporter ATP-binding protein [Hyphomicrobiales bacterium]
MNALETRNLNKAFGSLVVADDISIQLPKGARHALIGPNGAGKTTLINLMTGALTPDSGSVLLGDQDITGLESNERVKRGLGRTFQINTLFPELTPLESTTMAICERMGVAQNWLSPLANQTEAIDEAFGLLTQIGLADDCTKPTVDLAYGQQRLLEIALALATKPKVLLLDEPAAGIPKSESAALFEAIADLPKDISVLFIEHDMNLVFTFASSITVLVQGKVLVEGTPDEIAHDPLVREVYLGGADHG